ncbi:MAG: ABC transporter substrate-binding protein [Albidovulum sp.]|nr:ABC transporter substrate-binding protein [Albidovulum sp.]MDE0531080.1 ABC transporter substrate-binding protein [Albidovulum sp.]
MKLLLTTISALVVAASAQAADQVKIGVIFGFTGPIETLTPAMAAGAELAAQEVSDSGMLLGGATVAAVRGDSTCIDSAAATSAAENLITVDKVNAIVGADCSGVTGAILQSVAIPNGVVMISPSATSPGLSTVEDNGLFFRTAPSDARQGQVLSDVIMERGIESVAVTYTNNDYGKGLADSFESAYTAAGGTVTASVAHEDGKGDYSAEIASLDAAGGDALVVAGYVDQGGQGIIRASLDSGSFDIFVLPDGMHGDSLTDAFGSEIDGSFGTLPGTDSPGASMLADVAGAAEVDASGPFVKESYDAAALLLLAMQAANSSASADLMNKVMDVANAPGEQIFPGELAKGLELLAAGAEIDYVGGSAVELIGPGESAGNYAIKEIQNGEFVTVEFR